MKALVLKENFKKGLNIIEKITGRNLTLPILNNVLIKGSGNFLKLCTTDLEMGINYWILTKIEKEGEVTVPAKFLSSLISFFPNKKINLEVRNRILYVNCENYKSQINGQNPEEFPIIPKIKEEPFIEINSFSLCQGISQIVDFCAFTQIRPELAGVYFQFKKDKVKLVATDSFRLAEKTILFESNGIKEFSFILPQKATRELINIFSDVDNKLRIYFTPNQVMFECLLKETNHPQLQFISRLIEGEYPDYQEIIPKKSETQITLAHNEFLNQIKSTGLFSGKINEIKLKIKKEGLEIFSQNSELGQTHTLLRGKMVGQEAEASFNYRFLVDGLSNIKSQEVIFSLNGEGGPAVLKPVGDESYIYVVMPIKST